MEVLHDEARQRTVELPHALAARWLRPGPVDIFLDGETDGDEDDKVAPVISLPACVLVGGPSFAAGGDGGRAQLSCGGLLVHVNKEDLHGRRGPLAVSCRSKGHLST